jgi:hypothetical protein
MPAMMRQRPLISRLFYFMEEIFKDVPGYEGVYQASNLGRIKSLPRKVCNYRGCYISKEKIMIFAFSKGYFRISLLKDKKRKTYLAHQVIALTFLNHTISGHKIVVDHINHNKLDNRLENLQLITNRENCSKDVKNKTSKYTGVSWDSNRKKWQVGIKINGKRYALGRFNCEEEASQVYKNKLKEILC